MHGQCCLVAAAFPTFALLLLLFLQLHLNNPPSITPPNSTIAADQAPSHQFSLLIGILTRADLHEHRHFLRLIYNTQSSPTAKIDVKFIFCNLTKEEQKVLITLEILRYNDIIILNCTENMNNGKTYTYFSSLPSILPRRYDYVMKTDDDSLVMLRALSASLLSLSRRDLYYGFVVPCMSRDPYDGYMSGMGFVLSWDLVEWIAISEIPAADTVGPEDKMVGRWLEKGGKGKWRFTEKPGMYDYPGTNGRWCSHELIPETVVVHRLKKWDRWLRVLRFFNFTSKLEPSKMYHID